jgi:FkbM family methyltransferase
MIRVSKKAVNTLIRQGAKAFLEKTQNKIKYLYKYFTFKPYISSISIGDDHAMKIIISDLFAEDCYGDSKDLDKWNELFWLKSNLLIKGDTVADCGANIGVTGLFFAQCIGSTGKVVGFEALPANADIAKQNIKLNQINNFEIENQALGSYVGSVDFINVPNGAVGEVEGVKSIIVPMTTLDAYFSEMLPTFIKLDVEGYEIEVLRGAANILKTLPKLDIEIHCSCFENPLDKVSEILSMLSLTKYKVYLQLIPNGEINFYHTSSITAELISQYNNVHLFAIPKQTYNKK